MKKSKWFLVLMAIFLIGGVLFLTACVGGRIHTNFTGSNNNVSSNLTADGWSYSADSVNGNITARNLTFTSDNLASLHVESSSLSSGDATLILIQGSNEREVDISDGFSGYIDTSGFEPGERDSIRIRLRFNNARGVNINISW